MEDLKEDRLEIRLNTGSDKTVLTWLGHSDFLDTKQVLGPYLTRVVREFRGSELVADFCKLRYMNSSSVLSIIQLVKMAEAKKIKTVLKYDARCEWQIASFRALKVICAGTKYVTLE